MSGAGGDPTSGLTLYPTLRGVSVTRSSPRVVIDVLHRILYTVPGNFWIYWCFHTNRLAISILLTIYESYFHKQTYV